MCLPRVPFVIVLLFCRGIGQGQEPPKAISSLYDVHAGMPKKQVLSGLAEQYTLKRMDVSSVDVWEVESKGPPKEHAEIGFSNGKTLSIVIRKFFSETPDTVQFAKSLHEALHSAADAPSNLDPASPQAKLWKLTNGRTGKAEVQTQIVQSDNLNELVFFISMGGAEFRVEVTTSPGSPRSE